ncbi:MAG: hypothetical protein J6X53_02130 [Abditibacteriota bacterium]|nr:hypothetical protein [Abditibacteriota bacterium]
MLLTNQQKFLLDAAERLGCVREDQLVDLIRPVFCQRRPDIAPALVHSAMRQLRHCNVEIRQEGDVFLRSGAAVDSAFLEAVDVMLQLSHCAPTEYERGTAPVLLRFTVQSLESISSFVVARAIDRLPERLIAPEDRMILLFDGQNRPAALPVSNKIFFAARQRDGTHRFFAPGGP